MCRVRQGSQDDKVIHVIDADDGRLHKTKHKDDFDEIGGPTWRDDEHLKAWCYDDKTNSWHKSDEEPKPSEKKEKEPISCKNSEDPVCGKSDGNINENSDMAISNTGKVDVGPKNNELQLYRPENITNVEGTLGNNESNYYSLDSLESISQ